MVLIGGVLVIVFSYGFQLKEPRLHAVLTGGLALMVGLLVYMLAALDKPYRGDVSVSPAAYRLVLERDMATDEGPVMNRPTLALCLLLALAVPVVVLLAVPPCRSRCGITTSPTSAAWCACRTR